MLGFQVQIQISSFRVDPTTSSISHNFCVYLFGHAHEVDHY